MEGWTLDAVRTHTSQGAYRPTAKQQRPKQSDNMTQYDARNEYDPPALFMRPQLGLVRNLQSLVKNWALSHDLGFQGTGMARN
ncbi:hypothetical protein SAMN04487912_106251 [Arthrobacter sp. cf158]|nr:hypothetical protein SAMN04487912_106251 [Arthrobacter sp. cf158]